MLTTDQAQQLLSNGGNVVDADGKKIGSIDQIFLDDQSGQPEWVTTKTGMFGGGESFVPLRGAEVVGDDIEVPYDKDKVKDAPRIEGADSHLSEEEEDELYTYYGLGDSDSYQSSSDVDARIAGDSGDDDSDRPTSAETEAEAEMTRSEEQLNVSTETHQTGRARLRKFIVTENVTTTVPVSHEEVRLEREPITDAEAGDAVTDGELSSEDHDVVLTEERVVVSKETVPVERVRVDKQTVTEQEQVSEEVRKEQIELDKDSSTDLDARDDIDDHDDQDAHESRG